MLVVKVALHSVIFFKPSRFLQFLVLILVLIAISPSQAQEQPDLDALASQAATAIHKSVESGGKKVLVVDFGIAHAKANKLAVVLADRFAESLRKNTQGLVVLDRNDYIRAADEDLLTPEARAEELAARCYCRELGAEFVVQGTIDASTDTLQLDVEVERLSDWKTVFTGKVALPATAELRANILQPIAPSQNPSQVNKKTWIDPKNPIATANPDAIPTSGTRGTSGLACIYCPTAQFSDAAVKGKVQGTVILSAVIDATGHAASISVVRPLPCGLNTQAIEALEGWRLKPATDSDGKRVAVRTTIEMVFHLY
jgi:TonB family protein